MTVLKPRSRTISVRFSEEEFAALERFCATSDARSISDLARNAICAVLNRTGQENALVSTVNEYAAQVRNLEQTVLRLTEEVASFRTSALPRVLRPVDENNGECGGMTQKICSLE